MRVFEIMRSYTLQAAHQLTNVEPPHKCARLHGHTYSVELWCKGECDHADGWFLDFGAIDEDYRVCVHDKIDHTNLNDAFTPSTTENLAIWIAAALEGTETGMLLDKIVVRENDHSAVSCAVP